MMVQVTKIVAKSLEAKVDLPLPAQNGLDKIFSAGEKINAKKKVEKIGFSDKLGAVFGVSEPRPSEEQDG